jgi:taurine dioxygenase
LPVAGDQHRKHRVGKGEKRVTGIQFRRLSPFGAEVDLELSQPLDTATRDDLRTLFHREKLLVFRDQNLSQAEQMRTVGYIGPVVAPETEIAEISLDDESGRDKFAFHADIWFRPKPYRQLSLYGIEIDGETTTNFINGVTAAAALPTQLRERLAAMEAIFVDPYPFDRRDIDLDSLGSRPHHRWPAVLDHPETGEPVLMVSELCTAQLADLPPDESEALLTELFVTLYAEPSIFRHQWKTGDLLLWDNVALQHGRGAQDGVARRQIRRVVGGERSVYDY